jgi:hypothetical protein
MCVGYITLAPFPRKRTSYKDGRTVIEIVPFEEHRRNIIHSYNEERREGDKSTKGIKEKTK